jgi:hypothetical protein
MTCFELNFSLEQSVMYNTQNLPLISHLDRYLDEFGCTNGHFQMLGYEKYVKARLESLLDFLSMRVIRPNLLES